MMKIILFMLMLFSINTYSQSFNGIEVGKGLKETDSILKSKGFLYERSLISTIRIYNGVINGDKFEVAIVSTPKSNIIWKIKVMVDKCDSWSRLNSSLSKYKVILINKYGNPKNSYDFFGSPYEEGDGHEMLAIYKDKYTYFQGWNDENGNYISLKAESYEYGKAEVSISYENTIATQKNKDENSKINNETF